MNAPVRIISTNQPELISSTVAGTLPGLFEARVSRTPDRIAYRQFDPAINVWSDFSWREIAGRVARWKAALSAEKLREGDRVAVLLPNSVDWVCMDLAALSCGLVLVPLYLADTPENFAYFLEDSGARLIMVPDHAHWQAIRSARAAFPDLKRVVYASGGAPAGRVDPLVVGLEEWLRRGEEPGPPVGSRPSDLATIIYTSGTTGRPKGVMLSHANLLKAVDSVLERTAASPEDVFISYLPLAHAFERTIGYYLPMMAGCRVEYARSPRSLPEDLRIIRPTVFVGVPRVFERAFAKIKGEASASLVARTLLAWTEAVGWRRFQAEQRQGPPLSLPERLAWPLLRRAVAGRILQAFGGRVRVAVTGGAPMPGPVARFFVSLGLPLLEGYGLAEAAAPVCGNALDDNVVGSVGRPMAGTEVQLSEDGELLVRSPSVMMGYWNQPEKTKAAFDSAGWLRTGDVAEIVDGRIYIRGRIKDIIVTSTGEKVPPADMEAAIVADPLFKQALVTGERRPFLVALLVLDPERFAEFAAGMGRPATIASLCEPGVIDAVLGRLAKLLDRFPTYAQVRGVHLTFEEWTVDSGLMTTTMKIKRKALEQRFQNEIRALYSGHE